MLLRDRWWHRGRTAAASLEPRVRARHVRVSRWVRSTPWTKPLVTRGSSQRSGRPSRSVGAARGSNPQHDVQEPGARTSWRRWRPWGHARRWTPYVPFAHWVTGGGRRAGSTRVLRRAAAPGRTRRLTSEHQAIGGSARRTRCCCRCAHRRHAGRGWAGSPRWRMRSLSRGNRCRSCPGRSRPGTGGDRLDPVNAATGNPSRPVSSRCPVPWALDRGAVEGGVCVLAGNPGPMTLDGTNTWLIEVDADSVVLIDPGPDDHAHLSAVQAALGDRWVRDIVLTHGHADHSAGAGLFADAFGARVRAVDPAYRLGEGLPVGGVIAHGDTEVRVVATLGHTSDWSPCTCRGSGHCWRHHPRPRNHGGGVSGRPVGRLSRVIAAFDGFCDRCRSDCGGRGTDRSR